MRRHQYEGDSSNEPSQVRHYIIIYFLRIVINAYILLCVCVCVCVCLICVFLSICNREPWWRQSLSQSVFQCLVVLCQVIRVQSHHYTHTPKTRPGYRFYWFLASCVCHCHSGPVVGRSVSTHTRSKPSFHTYPQKQDLDTGFTGFWLRVCVFLIGFWLCICVCAEVSVLVWLRSMLRKLFPILVTVCVGS